MVDPIRDRSRRGLLVVMAALLIAVCVQGCPKQGDSVVLAGDGTRLSSEEIDRDPLALLPGGPVGLVYLDAQAAFQSDLGPAAARLISHVVPLGPDANFDAKRDVRKAYIGAYSLQGADLAVVVQGTFDPDAIRTAADRGVMTALGVPLMHLEYARNDLYTAGGVGFVVVTRSTAVTGNETGIRRVLDRIRDKRVRRDVPSWMASLVETPKASMVGVADLSSEPQISATAQQFPFLGGLTIVRVLGNFEPPGINFAGSLTYPDPASAERAAESLQKVSQLTAYTNLLALIGIRPPIQNMQVRTEQKDVQFIVAVDSQSASSLLDLTGRSIRGGR